ncbi:hypothetical protein Tco_0622763 [Tanacetum coccineum]
MRSLLDFIAVGGEEEKSKEEERREEDREEDGKERREKREEEEETLGINSIPFSEFLSIADDEMKPHGSPALKGKVTLYAEIKEAEQPQH